MSEAKIQEKTILQKRLDIVVIVMAALSTLSIFMTADDTLVDGLVMVVPIWLTAIAVYLRYWVANIFCIIGLIVCVLGFIFSPKMVVPCILCCVFITAALIDTLKAQRSERDGKGRESEDRGPEAGDRIEEEVRNRQQDGSDL